MANPLRNEVDIEIGGKVRTMRGSFSAITGIERDIGRSMLSILARGDLSVTDIALIIQHGLKGAEDTTMTLGEIGDAILEKGYASEVVYGPVMKFLEGAMNGVSLGKPQEAATTK